MTAFRTLAFAVVMSAGCSDGNNPSEPLQPRTLRLNFDRGPDSAAIASGAMLDNAYVSAGVTLSAAGPTCSGSNHVYASSGHAAIPGFADNVITTCPPGSGSDISEDGHGVIVVALSADATEVCIDAAPANATQRAFIEAFSGGGASLGRETSGAGVVGPLCIARAATRRVHFSGNGAEFSRFDNLLVTFAAG
jgi:hypothetical protein